MDWLNREALTWYLPPQTPALFEWAMILLPLTIYLIWLGFEVGRKETALCAQGLNRYPVLALGLSGFLLLGPSTWLISRYAQAGWSLISIAYAVYLIVMGYCVCFWIRNRRQSIVVYTSIQRLFNWPSTNPGWVGVEISDDARRIALEGQQLCSIWKRHHRSIV